MSNLITTIIGGVIVAVLISWLGIGTRQSSKVVIHGFRTKKGGKWIIIISVILIIWGFMLFGKQGNQSGIDFNQPSNVYAISLLVIGGIFLVIGKIITWLQRP